MQISVIAEGKRVVAAFIAARQWSVKITDGGE